MKKLTAAEKASVRDAVIAAVKDVLDTDRLRDLVFDALDGCANELVYNEEKCDALNEAVDHTIDKIFAKIK